MDPNQIITFVRTVPIFHSLEDAELQRLSEAMHERSFSAGEEVVNRECGNELFIVLEGELQAYVRDDEIDFERELQYFYPGDYFGIIGLLTDDRTTASVRSVTGGRALVLSRESFHGLFAESPDFARSLCRSLASHLRQSISQIPAVPFVRLSTFPDLASTMEILPARISFFCRAVAVRHEDDRVTVAMVNPGDDAARNFIREALRQNHVEIVAITEDDFEEHALPLIKMAVPPAESIASVGELTYIDDSGAQVDISQSNDQDVLPRVIASAITSGSSDIHIEPADHGGRIRFRIDGKLMTVEHGLPLPLVRQLGSRLKVMADLDITNIRHPQDGRFVVVADGRRIEFRVSVIPCQGGEKVAMRVIQPDSTLGQLSNLFQSEPIATFAEQIIDNPSGLVLVTGPTGAGKTTTLYAALNLLSLQQHTRNIVTIEDPVEYNLDYATQIQVNREIGLDYPDILRSVLRQDPDIILIGEIRDKTSAAIAVEAAATGHLVLSSLHTHSTLESIVRLRHLDVKPYLLANAIQGVISQQLVPRLCPGFTETVSPDEPVVHRLKQINVLDESWSEALQRGKQADGGPADGESGRVAVYELLSVTHSIRDLIDRAAPMSDIERGLDDRCYFSFARYSQMLLARGLVAPERIERIFPKRLSMSQWANRSN